MTLSTRVLWISGCVCTLQRLKLVSKSSVMTSHKYRRDSLLWRTAYHTGNWLFIHYYRDHLHLFTSELMDSSIFINFFPKLFVLLKYLPVEAVISYSSSTLSSTAPLDLSCWNISWSSWSSLIRHCWLWPRGVKTSCLAWEALLRLIFPILRLQFLSWRCEIYNLLSTVMSFIGC